MILNSKLKLGPLGLIVAVVAVAYGGIGWSQGLQPARPLVILIGPPLSGKTSLVTSIQKNYGIPGISIEDLIVEHASELRKMHPEGLSLAEMRYDPAISRYVKGRLGAMDLNHGVSLDGFPATRMQAEDLAKMATERNLSPVVLQMEIPDEVVHKRAAQGGRESDRPKIIEQRLKNYHREFDTISIYYPNAKIVKIDGTQSEEEMWKAVKQALDQGGIVPVPK
jgi:adenylate kinase